MLKAISSTLQNQLGLGNLVKQYRLIIGGQAGISVLFVKKQGNKVSHTLAGIPCTLNNLIDLMSPPSCVLGRFLSDTHFNSTVSLFKKMICIYLPKVLRFLLILWLKLTTNNYIPLSLL